MKIPMIGPPSNKQRWGEPVEYEIRVRIYLNAENGMVAEDIVTSVLQNAVNDDRIARFEFKRVEAVLPEQPDTSVT
jgi:hypothetical protein